MLNGKISFVNNSKQVWYGIAAVAVVLLVAWALTNRSVITASVPENKDAQATSTNTTPTKKNGGVTKTTSKQPSGWPSDAPAIQAKAAISYSGNTNPKTGALGSAVVYTVQDTAQNTSTYFKSEFAKRGWTFRGEGNAEGSLQLAATKDSRKVTVSILESSPNTLTVTVGITKL